MTPGQEVVLDDALRQLRLPAMVREWREYARQAKEAGEGYPAFCWLWPVVSWNSGKPIRSSAGCARPGSHG